MPEPAKLGTALARPGLRWALLGPALVVPFLLSFFYFVYFPGTALGNSCYLAHKVFLIAWPLVCVFGILREPMLDRTRPKRPLSSLLPGLLFGIAVTGLMFLLLQTSPMGEVLSANEAKIAQRIRDFQLADRFVAFAIFIAVFHSAMEEFYWRWFAFSQAKQLMPKGAAHGIAATGFALHHVVVLSQFFPMDWALALGACVGIGGTFWSWLFDRYHSLLGPWFSHALVDLGLMWVGWEALQGAGS